MIGLSVDALNEVDALASRGQLPEAESRLSELAQAGDAAALFKLADWNYRGVGKPRDLEAARNHFGRAAEGGIEVAGHFVTNLMASGVGGPRDWAGALVRLEAESRTSPHRLRTLQLVRSMQLTGDGDPVAPLPNRMSAPLLM